MDPREAGHITAVYIYRAEQIGHSQEEAFLTLISSFITLTTNDQFLSALQVAYHTLGMDHDFPNT